MKINTAAAVLMLLIFCCFFAAPRSYAEPIQDEFTVDSGLWDYMGNASRQGDGAVRLTEAKGSQVGTIWLKQSAAPPYQVSFKFKIDRPIPGDGGDGLVFMFNKQQNLAPASGGGMGFEPGSGYGVEFDTVHNGEYDQDGSHIALFKDNAKHMPDPLDATRRHALALVPAAGLSDGAWHDVSLRVENHRVTLWKDGSLVFRADGPLDNSFAGLGFSASTGGSYQAHWIDSFQLDSAPFISRVDADKEGRLKNGETVDLQLQFSKTVNVTGSPELTLNNGAKAVYASGSGTDTLHFTYSVDGTKRTKALDVTGLALNGGSIKGMDGYDANVAMPDPGVAGWLSQTKRLIIDGLVLQLDFEGGYTDLSGMANHGTANGEVALVPGTKFGQAVQIKGNGVAAAGSNGVIRIPDSSTLALQNELTASFYLRVDSKKGTDGYWTQLDEGVQSILAKKSDTEGFVINLDYMANPDEIYFNKSMDAYSGQNGLVMDYTYPTGNPPDGPPGEWHHVAVVVATDKIQLIVDGDTKKTEPLSAPDKVDFTSANGQDLTIGQFGTGWYAANISLDDVRLYNRALSETEVQSLYSSTRPAITSITVPDAPAERAYKLGEAVTFELTYSEPVWVSGSPYLELTGGKQAVYRSGSGSNKLRFAYVVAAGDGISDFRVTALNTASGSIRSGWDYDATGTLPAPSYPTLHIDGVAPTVDVWAPGTSSVRWVELNPQPGSDAVSMRFSNDGVTWQAWKPFATKTYFKIDGTGSVWHQFMDAAGNLSTPGNFYISYGNSLAPRAGADRALYFRSNESVVIPNKNDQLGVFTIAMRVYPQLDSSPTSSNPVQTLYHQPPGTGTKGIWMYLKDNRVHAAYTSPSGAWEEQFVSTEELPLNQWSQLGFMFYNTYAELYINGQMKGSGSVEVGTYAQTKFQSITLGNRPGQAEGFVGGMDDLVFFNRDVYGSELSKLEHEGINPNHLYYGNITNYFPFDYLVQTSVVDVIGGLYGGVNGLTASDVKEYLNHTSFTIEEDQVLNSRLLGYDGNDDPVTFRIVTGPSHGTVTLKDAVTGAFKYQPEPDYFGPDSFTFQANETGRASNIATVAVTVAPVNDPPSFALKGTEMTVTHPLPVSELWAIGISPGPSNEEGQMLVFEVTTDRPELFDVQPAIAADGTLTFQAKPNAKGTAIVTVVLSDGEPHYGDVYWYRQFQIHVDTSPMFLAPEALDLTVGSTAPVAVKVYAGGTVTDVTYHAAYLGYNGSIVSVSSAGMVTGLSNGSTVITVTYGVYNAQLPVTVTGGTTPPPERHINYIEMDPLPFLTVGAAVPARVWGVYSDGSREALTTGVTFTSLSPLLVSVDPNTGMLKGLAGGDSVIRAVYGSYAAEQRVYVITLELMVKRQDLNGDGMFDKHDVLLALSHLPSYRIRE
ncbi:LamG-like jellyroll fold domain-containing protein [Paenibacillus sp. GD4]|uniref:LamG-like jellyroll fold domain-containing protein n=1 Tax=Paenibacillus sp. GD4 TaxID=3068890 RepID=UPI0027963D87|nr:LamG-like jellyroll fold domain-containing protein [Paenibacillus sp. GD4]MDQ1910755.1 LamG-like jellyroll fold domain-containing protein [Paenibacillus sp. GD4]